MRQDLPSEETAGSGRFRNMLDCLPQMVWTNEPDGRQFYNARWCEFTGVGVSTNDDFNRYELIHPEDIGPARAAWDEAQVSGSYEFEYRLRHKSGDYRWIISRGLPIRDDESRIAGWYGTCTDIHDRRLYREALTLSEAVNRSIIDGSSDPILLIAPDGALVFMNEASRTVVGHAFAEEAIGRSFIDTIIPHAADARIALETANRGERSRYTVRFEGATGGKWWDVALAPVATENGEALGVLAVARDVTEARQAAAQVHTLQNRIIHVSRLSAMGTMAATLAHELNQPLTAAANYLRGGRRLLDGQVSKTDLREVIDEAHRQITRAGEIIRRSRGLLKDGTTKAEITSLRSLIESALKLCEGAGGQSDATIAVEVADDADSVCVDAVQTEQVLSNLVRNALEAMAQSPVKTLTISAGRKDRFTKVEVADTGPGLPAGQEESVFQAMHGASNKGLGLGLAISRTIIERQGGSIWATANDAGGASFCFTLPHDERSAREA